MLTELKLLIPCFYFIFKKSRSIPALQFTNLNMKRLLLSAVALVIMATVSLAQEKEAATDPKVLPMFGGIVKTEQQQKQDEKFLKSCDANFKSRQEASQFFMDRGWDYYAEGQIDTALYRFNLAWLLNQNNGDTYWAFGLVSAARNQPTEAIKLYEKAQELLPDNSLLYSDMGASYLLAYKAKKRKKHLKKATKTLAEALKLDDQNSFALYSLSEIKYLEKKYTDAWTYLHQARELNMTSLDYGYLYELMEKQPDPKGFFSSKTQPEEEKE